MTPSASLLLLLLLGLSQANPLMEEGSGSEDHKANPLMEEGSGSEDPKANPLMEEESDSEDPEDEDDSMDISTRILTTNNATDEILLEGDILAPRTRNAIACWANSCLWKKSSNGQVVVPFIISRQFPGREQKKIAYAMKTFHKSSCIRFVRRTTQYDYISIVNKGGCFSALGRAGGRQELSLSRPGCMLHGIIQHEFLHALGFQHEQTRSDRDKYVRINWGNINKQMAFNFYKQSTNNLNTPYDYGSVMHYGRAAFTIQRGRETITPIPNPNIRIGQRKGMSYWDVRRINLLYSC